MKVENFPQDTAAVAHTSPKASWDVWHRRFGHIGILGLKLLHTNQMVTGLDVDSRTVTTSNCSSCIAAKLSRTPFPPVNESRAKFAGEKPHCDIWDPYHTASPQGSTYFVTFIDDYYRQLKINFLKKNLKLSKKLLSTLIGSRIIARDPPEPSKLTRGLSSCRRMCRIFYYQGEWC